MRIAPAAAVAALVIVAFGGVAPLSADEAATRERVKQTLEARFPIKVDVVQPSPLPGVYEVIAGNQVAYADATGDYLLVGRLMDTRTRHDLSAEHLDAHSSIDFRTLPFDKAIRIVNGNGARQLAVFADPDCPYCQQLEKDLRSVTDVTVFVFLLPLEHLHPDAIVHAHAIWCAADRGAAWTDWVIDRKAPAARNCADDPIGAIAALAQSLHIDATPTLFLQNGQRIGGDVPLERLRKLLAQLSASSPPTATVLSHAAEIIPGADAPGELRSRQ
jgi:thiol:disulfide interchange protein DsbC